MHIRKLRALLSTSLLAVAVSSMSVMVTSLEGSAAEPSHNACADVVYHKGIPYPSCGSDDFELHAVVKKTPAIAKKLMQANPIGAAIKIIITPTELGDGTLPRGGGSTWPIEFSDEIGGGGLSWSPSFGDGGGLSWPTEVGNEIGGGGLSWSPGFGDDGGSSAFFESFDYKLQYDLGPLQ